MRHELLAEDWVITSDNSAGIGEKPLDAVSASDRNTAKFAARVALLEQWAAGSEPEAVLLHNFSGHAQWQRYVEGIEELFKETDMTSLPIAGSSETNMETLQSGVAVTMFGKRIRELTATDLTWFVYGAPLVGSDVLKNSEQVADTKKIRQALMSGLIDRIWPVGSKGIKREMELLSGKPLTVSAAVDVTASGGPATCVMIGVGKGKIKQLTPHFGIHIYPLHLTQQK
ncbi:alpha-ribazole-5-phosphate synthase [Planococcus salinus]|uniref:Alpha-ribazole-5-phosphate synthase n=1 Tax=Planococcus salinus TaxID=1848460 RepID=A0A3M8P8M2_9BACL|nr:alpha-ribazole-5-phosphate synthase [Planococcus salinus]RNF40045.1 alpha-ribazole-5-phosphate synthase [Planococcus salinus]